MIFIEVEAEGGEGGDGSQNGNLTAWKQSRAVARHVECGKDTQERGARCEMRDAGCEMQDARRERGARRKGQDTGRER